LVRGEPHNILPALSPLTLYPTLAAVQREMGQHGYKQSGR